MKRAILDSIIDPRPALLLVVLVCVSLALKRPLRDRWWPLVAGTVVAVAMGELALRTLGIGRWQKTVRIEPRCAFTSPMPYEPNGALVYRYSDNPRGYFDAANEVHGTINSMGFRGRERSRSKPPGCTRIVFLGDSFTLGVGVRDDDTLPAQVESLLQQQIGDVEVLNFGQTAATTRHEVRRLRDYALSFEPDVVVFVFFLNDVGQFISGRKAFASVRQRSYLANAVVESIERPLISHRMVTYYNDHYREESRGWIAARRAIRQAHALVEGLGADFIVVVYPVLYRLDEEHPFRVVHQTIGSFCKSERIQTIDLLDALRGRKDRDLWVHASDHHPNEVADALAAEAVAARLKPMLLARRESSSTRTPARLGDFAMTPQKPPRRADDHQPETLCVARPQLSRQP